MESKFKVGDVVQCVNAKGSKGVLMVGEVSRVANVGKGVGTVFLENTPGWWDENSFELVLSPESKGGAR